jgi:hypothetical protein
MTFNNTNTYSSTPVNYLDANSQVVMEINADLQYGWFTVAVLAPVTAPPTTGVTIDVLYVPQIGPKPNTEVLCPDTSLGLNLWKSKLNCNYKCIEILPNVRNRFVFEDDCSYVCVTLTTAGTEEYTFSVKVLLNFDINSPTNKTHLDNRSGYS